MALHKIKKQEGREVEEEGGEDEMKRDRGSEKQRRQKRGRKRSWVTARQRKVGVPEPKCGAKKCKKCTKIRCSFSCTEYSKKRDCAEKSKQMT